MNIEKDFKNTKAKQTPKEEKPKHAAHRHDHVNSILDYWRIGKRKADVLLS